MPIVLHKVLISDEVDPQCVQILKANGIEVTMNTKLSKTELIDQISVSYKFVEYLYDWSIHETYILHNKCHICNDK